MGERQNRKPDATLTEMVHFRRHLQRACEIAGGQRDLERAIGLKQASISKILKDGGTSGSTIDLVASFLGVDRDVVLGRKESLMTAVSHDPLLASTIEFAHFKMGLDVETINRVVDRLVQAKIRIDLVLLMDAFLWEKKIVDAGGPPGRPIVR